MAYIQNMALNRRQFKARLKEYLSGALKEFYKSRLATKNGERDLITHWMKEAIDLVERAVRVIGDQRTIGVRDKTLALEEVIDDLYRHDKTFRTRATNEVKRDYGLKRVKPLSDEDTEAFWALVSKTVKEPPPND